ncbi:MAG: hypothetical protein ACLQPH_06620 [Acidimicrobiales bacterium]
MAEEERTGLSVLDGVLLVGGGLIVLFVAFKLFGIIAGLVWFVVKLVIAVALIALVLRLVFHRRS